MQWVPVVYIWINEHGDVPEARGLQRVKRRLDAGSQLYSRCRSQKTNIAFGLVDIDAQTVDSWSSLHYYIVATNERTPTMFEMVSGLQDPFAAVHSVQMATEFEMNGHRGLTLFSRKPMGQLGSVVTCGNKRDVGCKRATPVFDAPSRQI
ncbi:hypothetical protein C8R44DRAFT_863275 [Mycena epipterygia]|nr:hypothetical protein C8R44DRAFT_863275 [Mycena epipterygia]